MKRRGSPRESPPYKRRHGDSERQDNLSRERLRDEYSRPRDEYSRTRPESSRSKEDFGHRPYRSEEFKRPPRQRARNSYDDSRRTREDRPPRYEDGMRSNRGDDRSSRADERSSRADDRSSRGDERRLLEDRSRGEERRRRPELHGWRDEEVPRRRTSAPSSSDEGSSGGLDLRAQRRRELQRLREMNDEGENDPERLEKEAIAKKVEEHRALVAAQANPIIEEEDDELMEVSSGEEEGNEDWQDPETMLMQQVMGISGFASTKGQDHSLTDLSGARKRTKRKYRQYMNRRGGFNRPLSPKF